MIAFLKDRPLVRVIPVIWDQGERNAPTTIDDTNNGFDISTTVKATVSHKKTTSAISRHILIRTDQVNGDWNGNFSNNDKLLYTDNQSQVDGPITIEFVSGTDWVTPVAISAAGVQIQSFTNGEFEGVIRAISTTGVVSEFRRRGNSNANGDGSAIFLGVESTPVAEIIRIEFLTTNIVNAGHAIFDKRGFAINQLSVVL